MEKTVTYLRGTSRGPERILQASRQVELYDPELEISPYRAGIFTARPIDCRGNSAACLEKIEAAVGQIPGGAVPICLGGEHTLSLGAIRALRAPTAGVSVLYLDAHADLRESYGGTPLSHASVMRRVHELGIPIVPVGIRALSREEADYLAAEKIRYFPGWKYAAGDYPWAEIADALGERIYLSIDLDAFDPSQVPGVGTPEPGGLGWKEAIALFGALRAAGKTLVGADLVELCPRDGEIVSEFFAARLLYKLIGYFFFGQARAGNQAGEG